MTHFIDDHLTALRAESRSPNTVDAREELLRRLDRDLPYGLDENRTSFDALVSYAHRLGLISGAPPIETLFPDPRTDGPRLARWS